VIAILDEMQQKIKHLRLDRNNIASAPQFPAAYVKSIVFEIVDQLLSRTAMRASTHRRKKKQQNPRSIPRLSQRPSAAPEA
jgi:hypothetical protein